MSDIKISFLVGGRFAGQIQSGLEAFDAAPHLIPKRILNKIRNTQSDSIEISFSVQQCCMGCENCLPKEYPEISAGKLDKLKVIQWMYENGYFSLTAADMLSEEIQKGTFDVS